MFQSKAPLYLKLFLTNSFLDCGSAKSVLVFLRIYVFWYSLILWKDSFKVGAVIAECFIHENRLYMYRLSFKFPQERVSRTSANLISYVAPVITLAARDWNLCSLCFNNFPTEESSYRNTVALGLHIILAVYQLVKGLQCQTPAFRSCIASHRIASHCIS